MDLTSPTQHLNIVGIDPGNNLGLASLSFDLESNLITVHDAITADIDKLLETHYPELVDSHGKLLSRTFMVDKVVGKYCNGWEPDFLAHETAFSSHGRNRFGNAVESFACLRENILAIRLAAMNYDLGLQIKTVNPNTVKYAVPGAQSSDKSEIKKGLLAKDNVKFLMDTTYLDQHAWDAIAIAYTFITKAILGVPKSEHTKRNKRVKRNKTRGAG